MAEPSNSQSAQKRYSLSPHASGDNLRLSADERAAGRLTLEPSHGPTNPRSPSKTLASAGPEPKQTARLTPGVAPAARLTPGAMTATTDPTRAAQTARSVSPPPDGTIAAPQLTAPYRGPAASTRVAHVRRALVAAVDAWWRNEALPSDELLQNGLLVLEAGHRLEEAQRTLLARTALARRHGIRTALRHLGDPERAASLLHEALQRQSLGPDDLRRLLDDPHSRRWAPLLAREIRADLGSPLPAVSDRAEALLQILAASLPATSHTERGMVATVATDDLPRRHGHLRVFFAALLLLSLVAVLLWSILAQRPSPMVSVPGGAYSVSRVDGSRLPVQVTAFEIDRTEVTNGAYAQCVARGGCPPPLNNGSATRAQYFDASQYTDFPVIHVTLAQADAYCRAMGKRLPTAAEWEVAASFAPATQALWAWPWGEVFKQEFVVSALTHSDAAVVRSRSTRGDSPLGAADMAGNVAEWTATPATGLPNESGLAPQGSSAGALPSGEFVVKGGSFLSTQNDLRPTSSPTVAANSALSWLGFRCASTPPE